MMLQHQTSVSFAEGSPELRPASVITCEYIIEKFEEFGEYNLLDLII